MPLRLLLLLFLAACGLPHADGPPARRAAGAVAVRPELAAPLADAGLQGVFVAWSEDGPGEITNDPERADRGFVPASTFKLLNSLIALDERAIAGPDEVIPWDGVERPVAAWNRDQTLGPALRHSAVWAYQVLARRVGEERMARRVAEADYGNGILGGPVDTFWLTGGLRITPREQLDFLRRLHRRELPFERASMDLVVELMELERRDGFVLRGKTGWATAFEPQVSWFVGWVERPAAEPLFFALQIDVHSNADAAQRVPLAKRLLAELGVDVFLED